MFSCFCLFIFDQFSLGKVFKLGRCHKGLNLKNKNIKKKIYKQKILIKWWLEVCKENRIKLQFDRMKHQD
jgi:hypothetical protein